jgi:hypothetical protein
VDRLLERTAVAYAVAEGGREIMWRLQPDIGLSIVFITCFDRAKLWLIVADDAENVIDDLRQRARRTLGT